MAEDIKKEVEVKQPKTEKLKIKKEVTIDKLYKVGSEITLTKGKDDKIWSDHFGETGRLGDDLLAVGDEVGNQKAGRGERHHHGARRHDDDGQLPPDGEISKAEHS